MSVATLTIDSRNYGAWSLRGWLLCRVAGLGVHRTDRGQHRAGRAGRAAPPFSVDPGAAARARRLHGLGHPGHRRVPAERSPRPACFPDEPGDRARCRSVCGEMHAGSPTCGRAAHEHEGPPPGLQGVGRGPGRHRPHRGHLVGLSRRRRAGRTSSAPSRPWPTPCTRRFAPASSPTTSNCPGPGRGLRRDHHGPARHGRVDRGGGGRAGRLVELEPVEVEF